jgi:hypothetical protein
MDNTRKKGTGISLNYYKECATGQTESGITYCGLGKSQKETVAQKGDK